MRLATQNRTAEQRDKVAVFFENSGDDNFCALKVRVHPWRRTPVATAREIAARVIDICNSAMLAVTFGQVAYVAEYSHLDYGPTQHNAVIEPCFGTLYEDALRVLCEDDDLSWSIFRIVPKTA